MSSTTGLDAPASGLAPSAPTGGRGFLKAAEPVFWACVSIGLFAGLWEFLWAIGSLNPLLLPPPHLILQDIPGTLKFFDRANKVGTLATGGGVSALLATIAFTTMRVVLGLSFGFVGGVLVGAAIHYSRWVRRLLLPTILMLAPISPVAWLPVAIFVFGIGDVPAIFLVFVTVFFAITLSVGAQIESVPRHYIHVARIMGASQRQTFWRVIFPAILPSLFLTLRLNLFGAWMVVLIAEAVGVGAGLGQITSMARATFNSRLVFFTMAVIGLMGFLFDFTLRQVQHRMLWWIAPNGGAGR